MIFFKIHDKSTLYFMLKLRRESLLSRAVIFGWIPDQVGNDNKGRNRNNLYSRQVTILASLGLCSKIRTCRNWLGGFREKQSRFIDYMY